MSTIYSSVAIGIGALLGLVLTWFVGAAVTVPPVRMELIYLKFEDGHFYQHIGVSGAQVVNGEWTARIWRDGEFGREPLCNGGGKFPYDGTPSKAMTPSYWTDAECPDDISGSHALASWEYTDEEGLQRRFSAQLTIP